MTIEKESDQSVYITMTPEDVESAVRMFICKCHEEYSKDWLIDAAIRPQIVEMHLTKED